MSTQPPTDVWVAPYLRLEGRIRVGTWDVIPADDLEIGDCTSEHAFEQVNGLLDLYRRPRGAREDFGCFLRRGNARVGANYRAPDVNTLHRALLIGVLDANRTPWRGVLDDPNWGWRTATSDALFLVWHRIDPGGWVSTRTGALMSTLSGGLSINDDPDDDLPLSEIPPPIEQHFPFMAPRPDAEYADVLFGVLDAGDARAQRVATTIDWLDLAWRNTTSISVGTRILLLKAGFEALLASDRLLRQRAALCALLGREAGRRRWHTPIDRHGRPLPQQQMTDVEWWYSRFTWLRNAIAHGGRPLTPRDWKHGRVDHFWLGDHWLRAAIRAEVARASGRSYLRETDPLQRVAARFVWEHEHGVA